MRTMTRLAITMALGGCAKGSVVDSGQAGDVPRFDEGPPGLAGQWVPQHAIPGLQAGLSFSDTGRCAMWLVDTGEPIGTCDWALDGDALTLWFDADGPRGASEHHALVEDDALVFEVGPDGCDQRGGLLIASAWVRQR
ncbi:MAG: hypothetical protein H6739_39840 [Alphaproteobacteria bacterium]|nr:hypothetical protein [Alphaproteobacteria bacterium]